MKKRWKRNALGVIELHHDYETKCELNLKVVGAFKYGMHKSCDILMLAWGTTPDDIEQWEPHKNKRPPSSLIELLEDEEVELHAHNAMFEFIISKYVGIRRYGFPEIDPARYHCTAAACAAAGLPRALGNAGRVLNLDVQKDKEGDRLIKVFCSPQPAKKPTKANPEGVPAHWLGPHDRPEEWEKFLGYNKTDVVAEMKIPEKVPMLNAKEQMHFTFDLMMNDRGLPLDMEAVELAMPLLTDLENRVTKRVRHLTGGINPTQRDKMLEYFNYLGLELENLQAKTLKDILTISGEELDPETRELLMLRLEGGKASTKKLKKMLALVCDDGRIRGGFLFYGAHTGRWSGKGIQPQNFTRGEYTPQQLEDLFWLLKNEDADTMEFLFARPIDAIAQGMRGFIKAPEGFKFVVSDFAAIEARMLAWLADEQALLAVYRRNGDVYVKQASSLYNVPEAELLHRVKVLKDKEAIGWRKFGKDIVLGCGFQMGGAGFYRNCISRGINVAEDFAHKAVKVYRKDNQKIVKFWYDVEECAIKSVHEKRTRKNPVILRNLKFFTEGDWFLIQLPSGRCLRYREPSVRKVERFGKMKAQLTFRTEIKGKWVRESTYGGKLVENITQAVARDAMVESMVRSWNRGYPSIGTVHDELITEVPLDFGSAKELEHIMGHLPKWCSDAPISAEGWQGPRYRK